MTANIIAGFIVLTIQLFFIDKMIRRYTYRREQKLWAPFRMIFLQGIVKYHDNLMDCTNEFSKVITNKLNEVYQEKELTINQFEEVKGIVVNSKEKLNKIKQEFYFTLQTVAPSMQPHAGEYCDEILYFEQIAFEYINKTKNMIDEFDVSELNNIHKSSHFLNGIKVMDTGLSMLKEFRLKNYKENFINSVWRKEKLHYFQGEFLVPEDYKRALETERSVKNLENIPRTTPIKNFFESKIEYEERVRKTGYNRVATGKPNN